MVSRTIKKASISFMPLSCVLFQRQVASTVPVDSAITLAYILAARLPLPTNHDPLNGTPVTVGSHSRHPCRKIMSWVSAAHYSFNNRASGCQLIFHGIRRCFKVKCNSCCQHLNMCNFFGTGFHKHVAVFFGPAASRSLEKVLHAYAYFAYNTANGLLQHFGKHWVRPVCFYFILKL